MFSLSKLVSILVMLPLTYAQAGDLETADRLATILRSARQVISQNKEMISDAKKGPDVEKFMAETKMNYARVKEEKLDESDEATKVLLEVVKEVITDVKAGKYASKWPS